MSLSVYENDRVVESAWDVSGMAPAQAETGIMRASFCPKCKCIYQGRNTSIHTVLHLRMFTCVCM